MPDPANNLAEEPDGPVWAAILAAAIGCAAIALLVDLAEASKAVSNALNFYNPTGDLSGKSSLGIGVWLIAWIGLHWRWKNRAIQSPGEIMALTALLLLAAMVAVFPPFFTLFG